MKRVIYKNKSKADRVSQGKGENGIKSGWQGQEQRGLKTVRVCKAEKCGGSG